MEQTMNSNMQPAKRGIKKSWIILGIIVVLVLWMFSGYNGLVEKQELATTELANVQTQYQRRADMMPQLAKIVKAYAKHEKETFAEVTKARAAVGQVKLDANNLTEASLKKYAAAQGELANAFSKLMVFRFRKRVRKTASARHVANITKLSRTITRRLGKCLVPLSPASSISM